MDDICSRMEDVRKTETNFVRASQRYSLILRNAKELADAHKDSCPWNATTPDAIRWHGIRRVSGHRIVTLLPGDELEGELVVTRVGEPDGTPIPSSEQKPIQLLTRGVLPEVVCEAPLFKYLTRPTKFCLLSKNFFDNRRRMHRLTRWYDETICSINGDGVTIGDAVRLLANTEEAHVDPNPPEEKDIWRELFTRLKLGSTGTLAHLCVVLIAEHFIERNRMMRDQTIDSEMSVVFQRTENTRHLEEGLTLEGRTRLRLYQPDSTPPVVEPPTISIRRVKQKGV